MFAVHAGIAIENARLHDQVQRLAVVEERERIGKDLHDGIIQAIYAVGLSLEDVPELVEDDDGPCRGGRARRPRDRRPQPRHRGHPLLHPAAAAGHGRRGGSRRGPRPPGRGAGDERGHRPRGGPRRRGADLLRALPPDRTSDLLFIAREALSNVARHSGATRTALVLARGRRATWSCASRTTAAASIPADRAGPGRASGRHQGLGNMRDRAVGHGRHVRDRAARWPGHAYHRASAGAAQRRHWGASPRPAPETTNRD